MPTEAELRAWLRQAEPGGTTLGVLDPGTVIRRSRRRRLPKQVAAGGTLTLAALGIGIAGFTGLAGLNSGGATDSTTMSDGEADEEGAPVAPGDASSIERAPAEKLHLCGGTLAEVTPSESGLELTTGFPATAPATGAPVEGTVILTNNGTEQVTGTTASTPAITISQDGIVLWHSNGPTDLSLQVVDLAPGESLEYRAFFTPVRCDVEDDEAEAFRADLPALAAGTYQVSAAIDLARDIPGSGAALADLVTGPLASVALD